MKIFTDTVFEERYIRVRKCEYLYLYMDMCSFIAEIGELQVNHKGAFKQKLDKILA